MFDDITEYVKAVRERVRIFLGEALPGSEIYEQVRLQFNLTESQMNWIVNNPG